jgi:hypothetical protein
VTIEYVSGSIATVHYSGLGPDSLPKERIEVLRGRRAWVLDDFRTLTSYEPGSERTTKVSGQDKGHARLLAGVLSACRGEQPFAPGPEAAYSAQAVALTARASIATAATLPVFTPGEGA